MQPTTTFDRCFSFLGEGRWFGVWSLQGRITEVGKQGFGEWVGKALTEIRPHLVEKQYQVLELKPKNNVTAKGNYQRN